MQAFFNRGHTLEAERLEARADFQSRLKKYWYRSPSIRRCTETEKPPTVEVPDAEMLPTVDMDGFKKAAINFKEVSKEFFEVVDRDALTSVVWDRLASSAD